MKLFVKVWFMCLLSVGYTYAQAQDIQSIISKNPELPQDYQDYVEALGVETPLENDKGAETAFNPRILNMEDIRDDEQIVFQTNDAIDTKTSALSNYYKILTGFDLPIYGYAEFNQEEKSELLFFNTMSRNYQLAAGDVLNINIRGLYDSDETSKIGRDNNLILSDLPPINVNGLTINQLEKNLTDLLRIDDASALVNVSLDAARLVTVQVSGNIDFPRTLAVPAYTPLSRVISYSGGISDNGSLRNISLSQIGETTQTVDFYEFLQNPSPKNDPLIKNGARIFIPNKGATIAATGFINKPGIYELPNNKSETTINELLSISGTSFIPSGATLKVSYFDTNGQIATRLAFKDEAIREGEALQIDFIEMRNLNISRVSGAVLKDFEFKSNVPLSIKEILRNGAVLSPDIYKSIALIDGKDIQAISLDEALEDNSITLPVGSDLRLFTKEEYLGLVNADLNKSLDPLSTKFVEAIVTEIYLDGVRIAYVPLSQKKKSLSLKEILRGGSILNVDGYLTNKNIYTSFALIYGEDIQAIRLDEALKDNNITLPVGVDLHLFTKEEYLKLVSEDPNKSRDPLVSKIIQSNVAEIYLDGKRIAYVPTGQDQDFYELVNNFYTPNSKTVHELALIENNNNINAFDLKRALRNFDSQKLSKGDRLFIYESKFFNDIISSTFSSEKSIVKVPEANVNAENAEVIMLQQAIEEENNEYLENIMNSQKILQQANLINIKLDGELFTYLPYTKGVSSSFLLKKLRNRFPILINEFAVVQNIDEGKIPEIKNLNDPFEIKQGEEINFISSKYYRFVIKNYDDLIETNLLSELKVSNAVKVYYDGVLILLLPPNYRPSELKLFENYSEKSDLYKLYVSVNTTNSNNGTWDYLTFGSEEFFSASNNLVLGASNVVNLFSNNFIKNNFINDTANINGVDFNINSKIINQDTVANIPISIVPDGNLEGGKIAKEIPLNQHRSLDSQIKIMRNSLRTISGSVQFPGAYPVAKKIRLSNFLSTAGLIEDTAKSNIIITEAINQKDRLIKGNPKTINLYEAGLNKVELSGLYYLDIPLAINDAITGIIDLEGEVLVPGKYSFTRSETLQDIIMRAGGLSDVAFPLGAILQRDSAKELEKQSNNILADQLEASILNLAQSSLEGAGDQVKVVLGYATQLRNQPTLGRVALNIINKNPSVPIFLEDGDKLTIPKRPSHVSIVGSVQRSTIATYVQGQSFNDYLHVAGGLTSIADSRKAYLLLPNGESRRLNKSTIIPVGSVIIVPPKLDRLSILGGTDIISKVLSNISNSILSIQNVD